MRLRFGHSAIEIKAFLQRNDRLPHDEANELRHPFAREMGRLWRITEGIAAAEAP
jgi:hypothetical protein